MYELPHEFPNYLSLGSKEIRKFEENPWSAWIQWRVPKVAESQP